ncbi:MAG: class I tRNA ligase family protein, partial [Nannocystaceae bacterium]
VAAEYVTVDSGTGIVHQAPAFGEDDYEVGRREGLPMVRPMGLDGVFDSSVGELAGMFAKDADKPILQRLKDEGKVVDHDTLVHPYPHCYRTDTPLLYMALSTWFMSVEPMRDRLVELNEQIHWVPEHVGSGRFGNWLASARDWNLARSRFWGTPLPIWRCDEDPSDMVCVGSIAQLEQLAGLEPGSITDLHRESIDPITFASSKTMVDGKPGTMRRVTEVFDCWFESGSMPYSQNHYPFDEARKQYVEDKLPADFIAEGLDQTRGWFYTLHVLAAALFDRPAFKHVIVNGLVLAEDGKKMSKRLKNYPDPATIIEQHGADALRAYLINSAAVRAEPMRFAERGVRDTVRKIVLPLWNAYNFLATYAQADGWAPSPATLEHRPQAALDRWIVSRLQDFVGQMRAELDAYALSNLVPAFHRICDDLNNWYIRRGRRRYWRGQGEDDRDKADAYATLFQALSTITHAIAPVIPFFSEWMYQRLWVDTGLAPQGQDSVHLRPYPQVDASRRDEALEADVAAVRQVANLAMAIRERERLAVRRPLAAMTVASPDAAVRAAVEAGRDDLLGELNIKQLRVVEDDGGLVKLLAKANFKALGKRLGKRMKAVAAAVAKLDGPAVRAFLEAGRVEVAGETLGPDDILVVREVVGEQAAEAAEGITVVLDTAVSDALRREGLAREIINRVQNVRKAKGLEVSDRIALELTCGGELATAAGDPELAEMIKGETLAESLVVTEQGEGDEGFEIDGEALAIAVQRQD